MTALGFIRDLLHAIRAEWVQRQHWKRTRPVADLNRALQRARELDEAGITETWEREEAA